MLHQDKRVQLQVVAAILQLGGDSVVQRILQALPVVGDEVKKKIILQLSGYSDEKLGEGLAEFLNQRFEKKKAGDDLIISGIITLRSYPFDAVIKRLQQLLVLNMRISTGDVLLQNVVAETLHIIIPKQKHIFKDVLAVSFYQNMTNKVTHHGGYDDDAINEFLDIIDEEIEINGIESGTSMLLEKVVQAAYAGKLDVAEMLRDKVLEYNTDALQEVLRVTEIIEENRVNGEKIEDENIWSDLIRTIGEESWRALHDLLRVERFRDGERIVSIDDIDPCLFFINEGVITVTCNCGGKETFLKKIGSGDIYGAGPFFAASVWTLSLESARSSEIMVLHRKDFKAIENLYPGLKEKLLQYVKMKENTKQLVMMSGKDRREEPRIRGNCMVHCILYDIYRNKESGKRISGQLIDISKNGMAFSVKIASRDAADKMLSRQLALDDSHGSSLCEGVIVGVRETDKQKNRYSIHVRFYTSIKTDAFQEIKNQISNIVT